MFKFLDVGSRGGISSEWDSFKSRMSVSLFEPDKKEAQSLISKCSSFSKINVLDCAAGDMDATLPLYITKSNQCSSLLKPDIDWLKDRYPVFSQFFEVSGSVLVDVRRIDTLINSGALEVPHALKIDVQGFEFQVMKGAGAYLEQIMAIRIEAHFRNLYIGEADFSEINKFLESKGFSLRKFLHDKPHYFAGDLIEVDAFYINRKYFRDNPRKLNEEALNIINSAWDLNT
ncbi:FkbM family methyltransferase [Polynucleobacter sp. JS-JIR-II-c23]|uniref:FkbM family methyltransferase n=1 Tax=Polynucleobacter sp. JS-JIR-II-c23 TaxID=1758393 RepID=UPI002B233CD6|nr:FkbM family methyltransferase [Polynucleobacter sp. JS-JIR-II-c23]MEA9603802.1 FkbM family methyltransferase [Polynucleobacter sp. JS-JIR-II-c23]